MVKTAAPTVGQYYETFKKLAEQGRGILCVAISSKLSGDYSAALNAANLLKTEYPESKVTVFDSHRAAAPQGLLAIDAAERLQAGVPMEEGACLSRDRLAKDLTPRSSGYIGISQPGWADW